MRKGKQSNKGKNEAKECTEEGDEERDDGGGRGEVTKRGKKR